MNRYLTYPAIRITTCLPALALAVPVLLAASQGTAQPPAVPFSFPNDSSGKLLAEKLPPSSPGAAAKLPPLSAQPRQVPAAIANPAVAPTAPALQLPKLPATPPAGVTKPSALAEELPLADYAGSPAVPDIKKLEVSPAIKVPSLDVNQPPVLGQVMQPTPEPPNLADPTQESSHQAALAGSAAPRTEPAPFLRLFLPDPFANRNATGLPEPPPEDAAPLIAAPQVPSK